MTERLLSPEEVSGTLGISPATLAVWRCTYRYDLPYVKIGGRVRYQKADILNFINSNINGAKNV